MNSPLKLLLLNTLMFLLSITVVAQAKMYMRLYPMNFAKADKGFYAGHTNDAVILSTKSGADTVLFSKISKIKTKRTVGHGIFIGALTGFFAGGITGLIAHKEPAPTDPNCYLCGAFDNLFYTTAAEDAAVGAILGGAAGTLVATIAGVTKKKETLLISGEDENWKKTLPILETYPVYTPQ
ncbi:hypothetical protein BH11BAC3_BH11BAC3_35850 [soil metagenome]